MLNFLLQLLGLAALMSVVTCAIVAVVVDPRGVPRPPRRRSAVDRAFYDRDRRYRDVTFWSEVATSVESSAVRREVAYELLNMWLESPIFVSPRLALTKHGTVSTFTLGCRCADCTSTYAITRRQELLYRDHIS